MKVRLLAFAALSVACSSSTTGVAPPDGGASDAATDVTARKPDAAKLAAFAAYCTGTLSVEIPLQAAAGVGGWSGNGERAPAGTTFLVSLRGSTTWNGFLVLEDGTPAKLSADTDGLVRGTEFTSGCAIDGADSVPVLMHDSTFFPTQMKDGAGCTIPAATALPQFSYALRDAQWAQVSSTALMSKCGFTTGYSSDIHYGYLLPT